MTAAISLDPALTDDELVQLAASVEHFSEHHIAKAILAETQRRGMPLLPAENFAAKPGHGVSAEVNGRLYWVGNATLMREIGIPATIDHTDGAQAARKWQDRRLRDR